MRHSYSRTKKKGAITWLISLDSGSVECFRPATSTAHTLVIDQYMIELAGDLQQGSYEQVSVYLK